MKYRTLKVRKGHRDYTLKSKPYSGNPITPSFFSKVPGWNRPGLPLIHRCRYPWRMGGYRLFGIVVDEALAPATSWGFFAYRRGKQEMTACSLKRTAIAPG